ncbi:MAG: DUF488 domain-containing protein [Dehalococcoidia bacterium]|jgi:uncharacterized protein (DUF488 family)|nr:MAG: DUF488 domain-containing protein [Dehalococcoidia bacterium]
MQIYTIGHSNHTQEQFVALLIGTKIQVLVDVRSNPTSRWATFADKDNLEKVLKLARIHYIYLGDMLGGRPSELDSYDNQTGKVDYKLIQGKENYRYGIRRILDEVKRYRVCIMCAEENPISCHRNMLVADSLRQAGVKIFHIRGDGRIQTDEDLWKEKVGVAASQYPLPM